MRGIMKVFFFLLLLSNLLFALFQWLVPYEQLLTAGASIPAAEQLQLLNETEAERKPEPVQVATGDEPKVATAAPLADAPLCYTLGPFKQQQVMQEAVNEFRQSGIEIDSRSSVEKEYLGMMVYIDGHANRQQALATSQALTSRGVREFIIVNEPGKNNALSLGVFSLKKNADRRRQRISALGYEVKTEARYRNRTIYWLDYAQSENQALGALVERLRQSLGISRIARQCA